jgi:CheY-like chemotaxis protein
VSSKLGKGSTFTLYLPTPAAPGVTFDPAVVVADALAVQDGAASVLAEDATLSGAPVADSDGEDPLNGARILIVDDDARSVFALTGVFERYGAEVLYAENGRAGIESLERNEDISLVLMDVMMPELDGNATMRAIRKMPQFADLPIIALTAKAMKGDREKSIKAGASDYFPKPVETDHLLQLMRHWLRRSSGTGSLRAAADSR